MQLYLCAEHVTAIAAAAQSRRNRAPLPRSIRAVTGIAEARENKALLVEPFIDGGGPDWHILVQAAHALEAFGSRDQANEANVLGAAFLQAIDRSHRRVRGRHHRRHHDREALLEIGG